MRDFDEGTDQSSRVNRLRSRRKDISEIDYEDFTSIDWPEILQPMPEGLIPSAEELREERRRNRSEELRDRISEELQEMFGMSLEEIEAILQTVQDGDLTEMSQLELLGVIAESVRNSALTNQVILEQQISMLSVMNDVARAVEPSPGVSVSGTNSISDAGVPEPVIANSDDQEIPTRRLWIRASADNSVGIYLGDDDVEPENGYILKPGEGITVNVNFRDSLIWMAAEEKGAEVQLFGVI